MASKSNSEVPAEWMEKYNLFNKYREESFRLIDGGISAETESRLAEAVTSYEAGLEVLDKALRIYLENVPSPLWDKYYENVQKMKITRKDILSRLTDLQNQSTSTSSAPMDPVPNAPPSYDEAMSSMSSDISSPTHTYPDLSQELRQLSMEMRGSTLYTQENVRMYFISASGQVGSLSAPSVLTIAQFEDHSGGETKQSFFLQVGDWIYPLVPGVSPVLHSEFGAFIIPDVHSPEEGSAVGLVLPEDAGSSVYEILDDILQGIVQQTPTKTVPPPRPPPPSVTPAAAPPAPPESMSRKISQGIVIGAEYLAYGLLKGAEKATEFLNDSTPKVIAKIQPEPEPKPIPPTLKRSMKVAKTVSGSAVQVTGYIAGKIGSATMALGRLVAPHVQTQGTRLLSNMGGMSEQEAANKVGGALEVTAGAVQGFGTVYQALENSAKVLASNLANNTVEIVKHKYGQPAGEVTGDTLYTMGNAVVATHNASGLTAKGIAKRAAKNTGKAVLEDYNKTHSDHQDLDAIREVKEGKFDDKKDDPGPSGITDNSASTDITYSH